MLVSFANASTSECARYTSYHRWIDTLGCAEAEKTYFVKNTRGVNVENTCRVQVCR